MSLSKPDLYAAIARGWQHEPNRHKPIDVEIVDAIATEVLALVETNTQAILERLDRAERVCQEAEFYVWCKGPTHWLLTALDRWHEVGAAIGGSHD